jgi:7,8-dihydroneopterin aldolase/epimerase/oxygenase
MFTIHLQNCRFFAHHGLHEEEAIVGAAFEVSLSASFEEDGNITRMNQTIDYVTIFEMVKKHFERPRQLLETLAQEIAADVCNIDARVRTVDIHLTKLNPPIANFTGSVGVSYTKRF